MTTNATTAPVAAVRTDTAPPRTGLRGFLDTFANVISVNRRRLIILMTAIGLVIVSAGAAALVTGFGSIIASLPQLATVSAPSFESERSKPQDVDNAKVRKLAGASLLGPIADRNILQQQTPAYPDWAEVQGVEATVSLYFVVRPDGHIKENILVEKTSGFEDFDANAVTALRGWRFEALGPGSTGEQWGRITFHYRLSSG